MLELELKFQVPVAAREGVRRAVATTRAATVRLQAHYFDTPDRKLAAAGLALRLRKEGKQWVQTLKGRGDGLMARVEHEVAVGRTSAPPAIDIARHDGTPGGDRLRQVLGADSGALTVTFGTDIRRTYRRVRLEGGVVVEVAFDEGGIHAGRRRLAVCEIEFESVNGPAVAVPRLAARWVRRHGLWLDIRTKAERGDRLARGITEVPAARAVDPALAPAMTGAVALRAMVSVSLHQALANAAELADRDDSPAAPEQVHQCRIGLRRMRTALRDFGALDPSLVAAEVTAWQTSLASLFGALGCTRDVDVLRKTLWPALAAAGAPPTLASVPDDTAAARAGAALRETSATLLWLEVLAWLHAPATTPVAANAPEAAPPGAAALSTDLRSQLRRLQRQIARDARRFGDLGEPDQHRVRKRVKRLRYGIEFCLSLLPPRRAARYLADVRAAQDALGEYTDLLIARAHFASRTEREPAAWFALGWIAARHPFALANCDRALAPLAKTPTFLHPAGGKPARSRPPTLRQKATKRRR